MTDMCTVTLSYDQKNAKARDLLAAIIDSGLFYVTRMPEGFFGQNGNNKVLDSVIDYSDSSFDDDQVDLLPLPQGRDSFTLEEFRDILMEDLRDIYSMKDEEVSLYH